VVEAVTHLGFYVGWPRATTAMTVIAKSFGQGVYTGPTLEYWKQK
jgi:alkylhydroperoxidase/carboxymuconolactone decarboxylase family protein YurZ